MRQDWGRSRRERSARQVVQRWEELPGVPAFYSSRLVEITFRFGFLPHPRQDRESGALLNANQTPCSFLSLS